MMRRVIALVGVPSAAAGASPLSCTVRTVTTRGQFNPIHDFFFSVEEGGARATNEAEFETMITNPGPLRVGYSPDYLDWLYRAYQSKVKFSDARSKAERIFKGALLSNGGSATSKQGGALEGAASLPGAPPPGHFLRPPHSMRRIAGEAKRSAAQRALDNVAKQQGMLDLFERQPQFPVIHIDKATRFHVVELFKELVLERALDPVEVWDKALMYRAILTERKQSYPSTFGYIFDAVDSTVLATPPTEADDAATAALQRRCPSVDDYNYFLFLVKRYYVDNAIEGHVVLRAHREANAADLLFSNPPPKDEQDVRRAIFSNNSPAEGTTAAVDGKEGDTKGTIRLPQSYPPIEALWRCEENLQLLRVLVFGELNLVVSENPFVKFPNAHGFLTRPYSSEGQLNSGGGGNQSFRRGGSGERRDQDAISLANVISEKRGHLLAPLPRNIASQLDGRAGDLRRLQQRYHREDIVGFQKLLRSSLVDENPASFSAFSDWSYFNPRAVRAEERDRLTRQGVEALKQYERASRDIYRRGYEETAVNSALRPTEMSHSLPTYIPTLPHFVSLIMKDPHISFLTHAGATAATTTPSGSGADSTAAQDAEQQLERLVYQLGRALHRMALEYHKEAIRRVNRQKVNVAAALLDNHVRVEWRRMLLAAKNDERAGNNVNGRSGDDVQFMARTLGAYMPFETRILDESGFPTDARVEDYARWMAPPAPTTS